MNSKPLISCDIKSIQKRQKNNLLFFLLQFLFQILFHLFVFHSPLLSITTLVGGKYSSIMKKIICFKFIIDTIFSILWNSNYKLVLDKVDFNRYLNAHPVLAQIIAFYIRLLCSTTQLKCAPYLHQKYIFFALVLMSLKKFFL